MHKLEAQLVKVGLFVVTAAIVGMFIIFMIGSEKSVFESHYSLKCTFSDISGLRVGAPVQLAGMSAGLVSNISFSKDLMNKDIQVKLRIAEKFQDRIREDSEASINTQGLLGDKYIFISVGSGDEPVLKDGAEIQTKAVVGLFELAEKGGDIMEDLHKAAKSISDILDNFSDGKGDMKDILGSIKSITDQVQKGKGLIHALIYDPRGQDILEDAAASMDSLRILIGQTEQGSKRRGEVRNIAKNINDVAMNLNEITEKINRGEGTLGGLILDPTIYNEIRGIFGKANRNSLFKTVVRSTLEQNDKQVLK